MEQPNYCDYPDATSYPFGCWSLIFGLVTGEEYCKNCELYKKEN